MSRAEELTEEQWAVIEDLIPEVQPRDDARGRPPADTRAVLNGVLWVMRTGDLPERYPPCQTCHRRFQAWARTRTLRVVLEALAEDLRSRGKLDLSEGFIDATFVAAKKGALVLAKQSVARGPRSWKWRTAIVFISPFTQTALRRMKSPLFKLSLSNLLADR